MYRYNDTFQIMSELFSAVKKDDYQTVKQLLKNKKLLNHKTTNGTTPLMIACKHSSVKSIQVLLTAGADVNMQDNDGFTALMMASINCNEMSSMECVRELLQAGADVNLQTENGWTALMMVSKYCNEDSSMECVRELLQAGADVNLQTENGWTALMLACCSCNDTSNMECVRELLQAGADVNVQNKDGHTALIYASNHCNEHSSIDCVRELLQAGADWKILNNTGKTAKDLAPENQKRNVKKLIKKAKIEKLKQEIVQQVQEELWAYGGVGYELLQLKHQLMDMK